MPMRPYPVICLTPGCGRDAQFKIAAHWSDGITRELKTYSLSCNRCVDVHLADAIRKQKNCSLTTGETLDVPVVFNRQIEK